MAASNSNSIRYENSRLQDYTYDRSIERGRADLSLIMMTILLVVIGVVMLLSASFPDAYYVENDPYGYFVRQGFFALFGLAVMFVASRLPMSFYRRLAMPALVGSAALLIVVLVVGKLTNGAVRWIRIGGATFQPSEVAKIGAILFMATAICNLKDDIKSIRSVLPTLGVLCLVLVPLLLEPHLSATIIIAVVAAMMLYVGGLQVRWIVAGGALAVPLIYIASLFLSYVSSRLAAWRDPYADSTGVGYQIIQSLYAIGSGGLLGLGIGNSRQKYLYLPEVQNDYIFSIVCEELGFIGAILLLALFALLILRCFWIARHATDRFSMLVGVGIAAQLALQIILNIAVCTNTIPSTGVSLPFFSSGGTALVMQMGEIGILLSISRDIPERL